MTFLLPGGLTEMPVWEAAVDGCLYVGHGAHEAVHTVAHTEQTEALTGDQITDGTNKLKKR